MSGMPSRTSSHAMAALALSLLCVAELPSSEAEELQARDDAQEQEIEALEERIKRLESELGKLRLEAAPPKQGAVAAANQTDPSLTSIEKELERLAAGLDTLRKSIEPGPRLAPRLRFGGETSMRLRTTDTTRPLATGSYGELLSEGCTLNHRLVVEMEAAITGTLSAGGKLRLTNEGSDVFNYGPERLSSELGSAFVRHSTRRTRATLGYFDAFFTPLTLMRWDAEDSPEGAGEGQCACPGAAGAVTAESLEQLGPDLVFEGIKLYGAPTDHVDVTVLFARSRTAQEGRFYRQHTYGTRLKLVGYHRPTAGFRWIGLTYVGVKDDKASILSADYRPSQSRVAGLDLSLPISTRLALSAEWVHTETKDLVSHETDYGYASIATVQIRYPKPVTTALSFLRMAPEYQSVFDALSYQSNRQGLRLSSSYRTRQARLSVWAFCKWLRQLEPDISTDRDDLLTRFGTLAIGLSTRPSASLSIQGNCTLKLNRRDDDGLTAVREDIRNDTWIMTVELSRELARATRLSLMYQMIDHRDRIDSFLDYQAQIASALCSVRL